MLRLVAGVLALAAVAAAQTSVVGEGGGAADTDGLPEGSTNLYYTDARARSGVIAAAIQGASSTNMILQNGASQSGDLLALKNAAGSTLSRFDIEGSLDISSSAKFYIGSGAFAKWQAGALSLNNSHHVRWSSGTASGPFDVGISRASAGLLRVTNGATTTTNGALQSGDLTVYDNTATTGVTTAVVKAGAGQSTTDLIQWQDNAGNVLGRIASDGYGKLPAVQLVDPGAKPSCTSDTRGMIWYDAGGAGVADTAEICGKDAADAYAWVAIATF